MVGVLEMGCMVVEDRSIDVGDNVGCCIFWNMFLRLRFNNYLIHFAICCFNIKVMYKSISFQSQRPVVVERILDD